MLKLRHGLVRIFIEWLAWAMHTWFVDWAWSTTTTSHARNLFGLSERHDVFKLLLIAWLERLLEVFHVLCILHGETPWLISLIHNYWRLISLLLGPLGQQLLRVAVMPRLPLVDPICCLWRLLSFWHMTQNGSLVHLNYLLFVEHGDVVICVWVILGTLHTFWYQILMVCTLHQYYLFLIL